MTAIEKKYFEKLRRNTLTIEKKLNENRIVIQISCFDKNNELLYSYFDSEGIASNKIALSIFKLLHRKNSRFTQIRESERYMTYKVEPKV